MDCRHLPAGWDRARNRPALKACTVQDLWASGGKGAAARNSVVVKGFGCRPDASVRPGIGGPASESLRRTNPRESDERLIVYGDLVRQRLWRGMFFGRSLRAESR